MLAGGPDHLAAELLDIVDQYVAPKGTRSAGSVQKSHGCGMVNASAVHNFTPAATKPFGPTPDMKTMINTYLLPGWIPGKVVVNSSVEETGNWIEGFLKSIVLDWQTST